MTRSLPESVPDSAPRSASLFSGLKVIDCASYIAAPAAATLLGDLGADVVKIEPPEGDAYRGLYKMPGNAGIDDNYPWVLTSRNKRSVALDLKTPEGRATLHQLISKADVFITNLPLGLRHKLGIDQDLVRAMNSRLIYASFTAYGETGPEADKPGFDATAYWARSGMMDLIKADASAPPVRGVAGMGDQPSGMTLFAAIVCALYRRCETGQGGCVSSSLLANGLWSNAVQVQAALMGGEFPPRTPRHLAPNPFSNAYQCRDGRWLNLVILNEVRQWQPLAQTLGRSEWLADSRFASETSRREHYAALIEQFDQAFAARDLADWRTRLDAAGISFSVVGRLADIPQDQQMRASNAVVAMDDGETLTVNTPFLIDGVKTTLSSAPKTIGAGSSELLAQWGIGESTHQNEDPA